MFNRHTNLCSTSIAQDVTNQEEVVKEISNEITGIKPGLG